MVNASCFSRVAEILTSWLFLLLVDGGKAVIEVEVIGSSESLRADYIASYSTKL
jgi:hypothetical protein